MPWTFAHPAFVLPLRRLGPLALSLPALAIGSMMPDLLFYLGLRPLSLFAHTVLGSVLIALPCGLIVLALLTALRRPLIHLLPQPHRAVLMAHFGGPVHWRPAAVLIWLLSVQLGCWSHLLIDLFTHAPPPGVAWLHWLSQPLGVFGGRELLVHTAMQVGVSALAVVVLILAWRRWLRGQLATLPALPAAAAGSAASDRWRWQLHLGLLLGAALIGLVYTALTTPPIVSWRTLEHQIFRLLVMATMVYVPALLLAAMLAWRRRVGRPGPGDLA